MIRNKRVRDNEVRLYIYAPNFEELRGEGVHIDFGLSIRPSVRPLHLHMVRYGLELGS